MCSSDLNINDKKERMIRAEVEQNQELLYPFINNMYNNRVVAVEKLNELYNLNVCVKYGSIWVNRKEINNHNEVKAMENKERTNQPDSDNESINRTTD